MNQRDPFEVAVFLHLVAILLFIGLSLAGCAGMSSERAYYKRLHGSMCFWNIEELSEGTLDDRRQAEYYRAMCEESKQ